MAVASSLVTAEDWSYSFSSDDDHGFDHHEASHASEWSHESSYGESSSSADHSQLIQNLVGGELSKARLVGGYAKFELGQEAKESSSYAIGTS